MKNPGNLRRFAVTQTPVETLSWSEKISKLWNNNNDNNNNNKKKNMKVTIVPIVIGELGTIVALC